MATHLVGRSWHRRRHGADVRAGMRFHHNWIRNLGDA